MDDIVANIVSSFFSSTKSFNESDQVLFYYFSLILIVFLVSCLIAYRAFVFYKHSIELKPIFLSLEYIIIGFTLISGINILNIIIYYFSNKTMSLIFLIPFLPVFWVLYGSKKIIDHLIHRSKKQKDIFKLLLYFINTSLVIYLISVLAMVIGFFFDRQSILPVMLALLAFFINQIMYLLIILFIQIQKSDLSSYLSKLRLLNVQIGYFGLFTYFTTLVVIFETNDNLINFIFINVREIVSFMIIICYYFSIVVPKWLENRYTS